MLIAELQISEDEISFLTGGEDPNDDNVVLEKLFHPNLKLLLVSEGSKGCRYYTKVSISIHGILFKDLTGFFLFCYKLNGHWMHVIL